MLRIPISERADLAAIAADYGFDFHIIDGEIYWDERAYYQFSLKQIEQDLEDTSAELEAMCLELVDEVVTSEALLARLAIPEPYWDLLARSWRRRDPHLYGRLDFSYNGQGPAKLLEYNADTPTSLYEAAFFQWLWLEDQVDRGQLPRGADQFNSIQEQLIRRFAELRDDRLLTFSATEISDEDKGTVHYLMDCALQAGQRCQFIELERIGINVFGQYTDLEDRTLERLFKLYPWEFMFEDEYSHYLKYNEDVAFLEPMWKAVLSNKGILPLLWQRHPGHPNLLPSFFADDPKAGFSGRYIKKPLLSREGADISLHRDNRVNYRSQRGGYGSEGHVLQAFHPLPRFGEHYTMIGSWLINSRPAGLTIREDHSLITQDSSRFVPHIILG